jgi:negative regulator of flagellin synthesis FlgM
MRVVPGAPAPAVTGTAAVSEAAEVVPSAASSSTASSEALQSAALKPALQAMRDLPEIDHAKVAELRDALAKGELPFNAGRLAALIESYHRGGGK